MAVANNKRYYYNSNDDVVVAVAQCGDYIREHAVDLIGRVVGDRKGEGMSTDIRTSNLDITIKISPATVPMIIVNKDTIVPITIPFDEE